MASTKTPSTPQTVRLRLALAWAGLVWERASDGLWRAATVLTFGIAFALTDALPSLPTLPHILVVLAFVGVVAALAVRELRRVSWPTRAEARARLEAASPVQHRPLTATEDTLPSNATPLQQALWKRHQIFARAALARLRSPWPLSDVARLDGFAVRAVAVLCLAIALIGAGRDADNRLARVVAPLLGRDGVPVTVKLWITPPEYTGRSPIYVESPSKERPTLEIPAGSKALVMVSGTKRKTTLVMIDRERGAKGAKNVLLQPIAAEGDKGSDATNQRAEAELSPAARIEVRQGGGRALAVWEVEWLPDHPPVIAFAGEPRDTGRGRMRIDYVATDDYGLVGVTGKISREGSDETMDLELAVPPFAPRDVTHSSTHDVGGHPWAGMRVALTVTAHDQAGQTTTTAPIPVTLPERKFNHPVAQEIAQQRKELLKDAPRAAAPARQAFGRLLNEPDKFRNDGVVVLALSSARSRLTYQTPAEAMPGLPELLWQTAVRVEDGALGEAEARLTAAKKALREAMERGASAQEIDGLVAELQEAFADFARAYAEKAKQDGMEVGALDKNGKLIKPQDIAAAMEKLRELASLGAKDSARQMLAELEKMLQAMQNAANGEPGENPDVKAVQELLEQMQNLTDRQADLMDKTFEQVREEQRREAEANMQPLKPLTKEEQAKREEEKKEQTRKKEEEAKKAAEKQQNLKDELTDTANAIENMIGKKPGGLDAAKNAMQNAADALQAKSLKSAAAAQGAALQNMEEGMEESTEDMLEALAEKGIIGFAEGPGTDRKSGLHTLESTDLIELPNGPDTHGMAARVREILLEIQRRASDRTRSAPEQDYLRRLMKEY